MISCPTCGSILLRSEVILIDHAVLRCTTCNQYRIEDDEVVIGPCGDPLAALRTRADAIDAERRLKECLESPIDDPRWERIQ